MRKILQHVLLASFVALAITTPSSAAPGGPAAPVKKIAIGAGLRARLAEKVQKNGQTKTRGEILDLFDAGTKVTLPSGKTITVQELIDDVEEGEKEIAKKGSSLGRLPKKTWMKSTTPTKIATQRAALSGEVAAMKPAARSKGGSTPSGCTPASCAPRDKEESARWEKQKGDDDVIAAYTALSIAEKTPDASTAACSATWDNGVYVLGDKRSLVRLSADISVKTGQKSSATAKTALYVLGQSSPTWSKTGKIEAENLDRTFATPKVTLGYAIVPLVTLDGSV